MRDEELSMRLAKQFTNIAITAMAALLLMVYPPDRASAQGLSCADAVQLAKKDCGKIYSDLRDDPKNYKHGDATCEGERPTTEEAQEKLRESC